MSKTAAMRIRLAIEDVEKAIEDEDSHASLELEDVVRDNIDEIEDVSEEDRDTAKELAEKIEHVISWDDDFDKARRYLDALKELLPEQKRPALSRYLAEKEDDEEQREANAALAAALVDGVIGLAGLFGSGASYAGNTLRKWRTK